MRAFRVRYRHNNALEGGRVEDVEEFIADDVNAAREMSAQIHWRDEDFEILAVDEFEVPDV